jgi:hypothetical protein
MESKQDQNPAVQTLSPVTPGLWCRTCSVEIWASTGLGSHTQCLANCSPQGSSLELPPLIACSFPGKISTFLTSPTFWGLHYRLSCTLTVYTSSLKGRPAGTLTLSHIAWLPRLSTESWVKDSTIPQLLHSACLQTSIMWMIPRPTACSSSCQAPLDHSGSSLWEAGRLSTVKQILGK